MTGLIGDNNPNNAWGNHVIEVTLKQWKYEKPFSVKVSGNCHGFTLFETAIALVYDGLPVEHGLRCVVLVDPSGETLICEDESKAGEEWLRSMVVSCRIIDFEPPTLNEIRRRNGAEPVADGDKSYVALGS
ncbi:hypothetical protein ACVIGB_000736 [Bradyrhizobium sp. USDA 4341]